MERLKLLRKENHITQGELAQALHVGRTTVTMWEQGNMPSGSVLQQVADYFNVTTDYLLGRDEQQKETIIEEKTDPDDDLMELREQLRHQPGMRTLFKAARGATVEDLERAAKIIEALKGTSDD